MFALQPIRNVWSLPFLQDDFLTHKCRNSIAVVESFAKAVAGGKECVTPVDPAAFSVFMDGITKGFHIQNAKGIITPAVFETILIQVKSKLLEFMLELKDKFPDDESENIKQISEQIGVGDMFNHTVFGNGAIVNVNVGADNKIQQFVYHSVIKNDLNSLLDDLRKHNVSEADLQSLSDAIAIDAETVDHRPKDFGQKVKEWMGRMVAKSGTAAWNVSTQTAVTLLASAIAQYYGF